MKNKVGLYVIIAVVAILIYILIIRKSNKVAITPPTGSVPPVTSTSNNPINIIAGVLNKIFGSPTSTAQS